MSAPISEAERRVLRNLLASLESVRTQRQAAVGLTVAINTIKRRLR